MVKKYLYTLQNKVGQKTQKQDGAQHTCFFSK